MGVSEDLPDAVRCTMFTQKSWPFPRVLLQIHLTVGPVSHGVEMLIVDHRLGHSLCELFPPILSGTHSVLQEKQERPSLPQPNHWVSHDWILEPGFGGKGTHSVRA